MAKPTRAQLEVQVKALRQHHISKSIATIAVSLFRYSTVCFCFYCIYLSVLALAGKTTLANIIVNFLGNFTISQGASYAAGAGGVTYGYIERRRRMKAVKHLHAQNKKLEQGYDPRRSSSNLTETGETNPADLD